MKRTALAVLCMSAIVCSGIRCVNVQAEESNVKVTREIQASIDMGLRYLASQQRPDGSYLGSSGDLTGPVAAATLAYMAVGNLSNEGPYAHQVSRGVTYLLNSAQPDGIILKNRKGHGTMYNHGLATLCLAEAWGMTRDPRIIDKLEKAIELQVRAQGPRGSWTYEPEPRDGDMSITIMQVLALRAAYDAGVAVPKETIDRAVRYINSCQCKPDAQGLVGYGYSGASGPKFSTTAAAVMSLQVCGDYRPKSLKPGLDYLMSGRQAGRDNEWFLYGHYYAVQAMFQASRHPGFQKYWDFWYPSITKTLMSQQVKTGANRGEFKVQHARVPGVMQTAWSILILAVPYNYLPIYQK
ncbi:MAG: terpene cyclase/mutase family protein [Planctomycetes bacterium]|nr:terpene cyclase/mutase family protein [Planctomycetota bacterium]